MVRVLLASIVVYLAIFYSLINQPPVKFPDIEADSLPNGCMIYTAAYQGALNARRILNDQYYWSSVAAIKFKHLDMYHAILVFDYNQSIWIYDCNQGAFMVSSNNALDLKTILLKAYPDYVIEDCFWVQTKVLHPKKESSENE
jgi:hypothetical protein